MILAPSPGARCPFSTRRGTSLVIRGLHYGSPTARSAAPANVKFLQLGVVVPGALVLIVVGELAPRFDPAPGVDEDLLPGNDCLAVGIAGVIDEARIPSTDRWRSVDHGSLIERKEKGVVALHLRVVVSAIGFVVVDPLSSVLEDPRSFADVAGRKNSSAVDAGSAHSV